MGNGVETVRRYNPVVAVTHLLRRVIAGALQCMSMHHVRAPHTPIFAELDTVQRVPPWNSPLVVFVVVFCLVLATASLVARELPARNPLARGRNAPAFVPTWRSLAAAGQSTGSAGAAVTVVVFADYQCPGCAELHRLLRAASADMPSRLRVVHRHFPLTNHTHARVAANAAECAAVQGRFNEFEDATYRQQDSIGLIPFSTIAARAGVADTSEFVSCLREQRYASTVERDRSTAKQLGLAGTPTYIVNGSVHFGAPSEMVLRQQLSAGTNNER